MASETLNRKTKELLVNSIKNIMTKKPLDKITVSDVTNDCGVSRRAFYYHFCDIYDAVGWVCERDLINLIGEEQKDERYSDKANRFLEYLIDNREMYSSIQKSSQAWRIKNMYFQITSDYILRILKNDTLSGSVADKDLKTLADCYGTSVVAIISSYLLGELNTSKEFLISLIDKSIIDSYRCSLKAIETIRK